MLPGKLPLFTASPIAGARSSPPRARRGGAVRFTLSLMWGCATLSTASAAEIDSLALVDPGARGLGRGGASRADVEAVSDITNNLATTALMANYAVYGGISFIPGDRFGMRVGAMDSRTAPVALGFQYARRSDEPTLTGAARPGWVLVGDPLTDPTVHQGVALGLAVPMLSRRLTLGVTGRHDWREGERSGTDNATNVSVSAAGMPAERLVLSFGARNLVLQDFPDTERQLDAGARFLGGETFALELDAAVPLDTQLRWSSMCWMGGVDVIPLSWLILRAGASQQASAWWVHGGLTVGNEKGGLEYGVRVSTTEAANNWHGLDLAIRF